MPFRNSPDLKILRAPAACRRNLVFIRAGAALAWPFVTCWAGPARGFDIAASYFAPPDENSELFRNADFVRDVLRVPEFALPHG